MLFSLALMVSTVPAPGSFAAPEIVATLSSGLTAAECGAAVGGSRPVSNPADSRRGDANAVFPARPTVLFDNGNVIAFLACQPEA